MGATEADDGVSIRRTLMYPCWQRSSDPVGVAEANEFFSPGRRDEIAIERLGVVHVMTEVCDDDPGYAYTDVFIQT